MQSGYEGEQSGLPEVAQNRRGRWLRERAQRHRTPAESLSATRDFNAIRLRNKLDAGSAWTREATSLWMWSLERFSDKPEKVLIDRPRTGIWQTQLSPNGRWIVFVATGRDIPLPQRVVVASMDGAQTAEWTPLVQTPSMTDKPRWAPDGRTVYFLTSRGGFYNLGGIRFDPDRGVAMGQPFDVTPSCLRA